MLPSIALVHSVEMMRDGGSLAAIFQGANGSPYWLFIEIDRQTLPSGEWRRDRYLAPIIIERKMATAINITWQHALIFLNQIRPFLQKKSTKKCWILWKKLSMSKVKFPAKVLFIA